MQMGLSDTPPPPTALLALCVYANVRASFCGTRLCLRHNGTLRCATPVAETLAGAFCHVTAASQRFRICMFCLKYSEYLVHGLQVIIKRMFYLKRLCFVSLAWSFQAQLTMNISANTKCRGDVVVLFFCDLQIKSTYNSFPPPPTPPYPHHPPTPPTHTYADTLTNLHQSNSSAD